MGNKSKMSGATSRTFGKSRRNTRNGGCFGGPNRWRGTKMLVEVHSKHPKGHKSYEQQVVPLKIISYGVVNQMRPGAIDTREA